MKKLLAVLLAALLLAAPAFAQTAGVAGEWTMTKTVASGCLLYTSLSICIVSIFLYHSICKLAVAVRVSAVERTAIITARRSDRISEPSVISMD